MTLHPRTAEIAAQLGAVSPEMLAHVFIVSEASVAPVGAAVPEGTTEEGDFAVSVAKASGEKCQRCWVYSPRLGPHRDHPQLCERCVGVIGSHAG